MRRAFTAAAVAALLPVAAIAKPQPKPCPVKPPAKPCVRCDMQDEARPTPKPETP